METRRPMDPLLLIGSILLLAAALTWVVPAGRYERRLDAATGQSMVEPESYRPAPRRPVSPWEMLLAIPQGLVEAGSVIFYVFLAGGALSVVEKTGAIGNTLDHLVARFGSRPELILVMVSMLFLAGGASYGMYEEILAFLPLLCALMARLGLDGEMALGISLATSTVAGAFSPINTFLLGVSQPMAELRLFSGFGFRLPFFLLAIAVWLGYLIWYARRRWATTGHPAIAADAGAPLPKWRPRDITVLAIMNGGMAGLVAGAMAFGWGMKEFSAVFVAIGFAAGLAGGLGLRGTAEAMAEGFHRMAFACLLIGFARSISVVMANGSILDTIAHAVSLPLMHAPLSAAGVLMLAAESTLAFPMPSDSGRAVMSLPVMIPLSDVLGLARQMAVFAFQSSSLASGLITPTAGSLLAMLAFARVPFASWLRFLAIPLTVLFGLASAAIVAGVLLGVK